jgi:hypothetical protein
MQTKKHCSEKLVQNTLSYYYYLHAHMGFT